MKNKNDLGEIIIRTFRLDTGLYNEMKVKNDAISQALIVIVISSIAAGIGSVSSIGIKGVFVGSIGALIDWFIWAYIVYFICLKIINKNEISISQGEFLKIAGFSSGPGIIKILGVILQILYLLR